ncbi:MAG TPA: Sir2 family NAD-dependent protein deacetylase [Methylomirabilota bacterium]|nr:Sir2 family NAD-dependent protein deacetylase [Methylomirabilota bacterium]
MNTQPLAISSTDRLFLLTGAGVSAESGIPTFRDSNGLWCNYRFEDVATPTAWRRDPHLVWDFYSMRRREAVHARPNPAHQAIAALQHRLADRLFLCTQNIDNLHELAGSPRTVHMHGELFKSRCESCSRPPFDDSQLYQPPAAIPRCDCGAQIRPHICWFGEVPYDLDEIYAALDHCTTFFAIGTSGTVEPAASFAAHAARHAKTYYVGPEPPVNLRVFRQCFLGKAGQILPDLFAAP